MVERRPTTSKDSWLVIGRRKPRDNEEGDKTEAIDDRT